MKLARVFGLTAYVLLLAGAANAGILRVPQSLDWTANGPWPNGPWFIIPNEILDHSPYYRGMWEDWGWTHDVTELMPAEAIGIQSASLKIDAWDVGLYYPDGAEVDVVYANGIINVIYDGDTPVSWKYAKGTGTQLDILEDTAGRNWGTTTLALPAHILDDLWADGDVFIGIDIDSIEDFTGHRVTLKYSTLMVDYIMPASVPGLGLAVQRFWSPTTRSHFYTTSEVEKEKLIYQYSDKWTYESIAFYGFADDTDPSVVPVYRFWSDTLRSHFYTIDEAEKEKLVTLFPHVWAYEGPAFYAYPEGDQPSGMSPVYRFWSDGYHRHFYTISEGERQKLIDNYSDVWISEGIAYYAYKP